ncbi:MAG: hypothetical protein P4N60_12480 [Verrucomicrobiae bacterium]|nr:hypothetical protein [Verrucomicrobiae bacterium]
MNNSELDKKLKAAREPALPEAYQAAFPQTVLASLRSTPWKPSPPRRTGLPRLAWGLATAACVVLAFSIGHWRGHVEAAAPASVLANARLIRETMTLFPNQVRAIVQDEHGLKLVLADQPDVPNSTPLYVKICDGKTCSSLVTFSGQEIQIAGQKLTVLADASGGIILEGNKFVWSSTARNYALQGLKIEARPL